jgi:pimeloyl-ACP methyl ester carboxylesterase
MALADIESEYVMRQQHQSVMAYGRWCSSMYSVNDTARYASTVATAQDMLHYIELSAQECGQPAEEAKLWYYGISYGSVLGPTFASLYPSRVGRMIIDGVLDLQDYYSGTWESAIDNSDKAVQYLFQRCFEAGPLLCSFHQNATSWQEIEARYQGLLETLKESPIGVGGPLSNTSTLLAEQGILLTPAILKWTDIVAQMFYASYLLSPVFAISADAALVSLQLQDREILSTLSTDAQISSLNPSYDERMARSLIICLDAYGSANFTEFDDYKAFVGDMHDNSRYGGLSVAAVTGPICSQLNVHPPDSQTFDGIPDIGNTSVPILFIGGIADPITPLSSARKMHGIFEGSGLLLFNNSGVGLQDIYPIDHRQDTDDYSTPHTSRNQLV